jgi:hypothetical protein
MVNSAAVSGTGMPYARVMAGEARARHSMIWVERFVAGQGLFARSNVLL